MNNGAGTFGALAEYPVGGNSQDAADRRLQRRRTTRPRPHRQQPQIGVSLLRQRRRHVRCACDVPQHVRLRLACSRRGRPQQRRQARRRHRPPDRVLLAPCVAVDAISVVLGNGDGTFQPSREIPVGRGMSEIAVGDYNRDGFKDLAIGRAQGQVYLLHGVGDRTFVQRPTVWRRGSVLHPRHGHRRRRLQRRLDPGPRGVGTAQREPDGDPDRQRRRHVPRTAGPPRPRSSTFLSRQAVADYNGDGFQEPRAQPGRRQLRSDADTERQRQRHVPGRDALPPAAAWRASAASSSFQPTSMATRSPISS